MTPDTATTTVNYTATKSAKHAFLEQYERNHASTLRVLKAFPGERSEFRPHERSSSALKLAWTFVIEESLMLKAARGEQVLGSGFPPPPDTWDQVLAAFDKVSGDLVAELRDPRNADLDGAVKFFTGPKQTADFPIPEFLSFLLDDQIHHRGQLSVYVRMTGGKVPAIYGPSADEPWF
jgi:uncharacterized damage-inducible protein DinB